MNTKATLSSLRNHIIGDQGCACNICYQWAMLSTMFYCN